MTYCSGCHFERTAFGADGELTSAVKCNCSICARSGFLHWRIEREQLLRMLTSWEHLSSYIWGSGKARAISSAGFPGWLRCGFPRRNLAQFAVNIPCLEFNFLQSESFRPCRFSGRIGEIARARGFIWVMRGTGENHFPAVRAQDGHLRRSLAQANGARPHRLT
jgi:hypothetical protein